MRSKFILLTEIIYSVTDTKSTIPFVIHSNYVNMSWHKIAAISISKGQSADKLYSNFAWRLRSSLTVWRRVTRRACYTGQGLFRKTTHDSVFTDIWIALTKQHSLFWYNFFLIIHTIFLLSSKLKIIKETGNSFRSFFLKWINTIGNTIASMSLNTICNECYDEDNI